MDADARRAVLDGRANSSGAGMALSPLLGDPSTRVDFEGDVAGGSGEGTFAAVTSGRGGARRGRRKSAKVMMDMAEQILAEPVERWRAPPSRGSSLVEGLMDFLYVLPLQSMFALPFWSWTYALYFAATFNSWLGQAFYATRFDTDDLVTRAFTTLTMLGVVCMHFGIDETTSDTIGGHHIPSRTFALGYVFVRTMLVLNYVRAWLALPKQRVLLGLFATGFSVSVILWTMAAYAGPTPAASVLATTGIVVDYATPFMLLPRMVSVHPRHMPERFAAWSILASAGTLFALAVSTHPPPVGDASGWSLYPMAVWLLAAYIMVMHLLLYAKHVGLLTQGFEGSMPVKLRAYVHLYSHLFLTGFIEGASTAISTIDCTASSCAAAPGAVPLYCRCLGGALIVMALLHATGEHGSMRRAFFRALCGLVVALLPTFSGGDIALLPALGTIAALAFVQVLADYSEYMSQPATGIAVGRRHSGGGGDHGRVDEQQLTSPRGEVHGDL